MKEIFPTDTSPAALSLIARDLVATALAGQFPSDPLIDPELSQGISKVSSVVKRHGLLLQTTLARALAASGRFVVWTDVTLPITMAARDLLGAKNACKDLERIRLPADSDTDRMVTLDLAVVDPDAGWAGTFEIKRGNGATETRKRQPIEQALVGSRLVLRSFLEKLGYSRIETVTSAVIDYYGGGGFSPDLTLTRDQLDEYFQVPVVETVDAMTAALRDALETELPHLFGPYLARVERKRGTAADLPPSASDASSSPQNDIARLLRARPVGPGARRTNGPTFSGDAAKRGVPTSHH
jgi:hypothetical protein